MTCQGCVGAVDRVLKKMPGTHAAASRQHLSNLLFKQALQTIFKLSLPVGVQSVDIDLPSQKVLVKGDVTPEAVVQQVSKTGKPTELWS